MYRKPFSGGFTARRYPFDRDLDDGDILKI